MMIELRGGPFDGHLTDTVLTMSGQVIIANGERYVLNVDTFTAKWDGTE